LHLVGHFRILYHDARKHKYQGIYALKPIRTVNIAVFRAATPCVSLDRHNCCGSIYCLQLQSSSLQLESPTKTHGVRSENTIIIPQYELRIIQLQPYLRNVATSDSRTGK